MNELLQKLKNDKKRLLPGLLLAAAVLVLLLWAMVARVMVPANRYSQAEKLGLIRKDTPCETDAPVGDTVLPE